MFQKQPPGVFYKKSGLENFAKFTEKNGVFFLIKLQVSGLQLRLQQSCFPVNFEEILRIH